MNGAIFHSHFSKRLHVVATKYGLIMVEEADRNFAAMCKELISVALIGLALVQYKKGCWVDWSPSFKQRRWLRHLKSTKQNACSTPWRCVVYKTIELPVTKFEYICAPVSTYSVSAVYRGPKKKLKIKEINGS
jgi:hypothetical protein